MRNELSARSVRVDAARARVLRAAELANALREPAAQAAGRQESPGVQKAYTLARAELEAACAEYIQSQERPNET